MNSTQQQCFMLAAEYMNFTRAAERLYITQPALSRNISALEDELGLLLFVRRNNVLTITPGGKLLYDWMCRAEQDFAQVLEDARSANAAPKQALHIGFVKSELPPREAGRALQHLRSLYPDVELVITHYLAQEIISRLEDHSMDVALMIGSATYGKSRLVTRTLASFQRCVAVPISHPLAGQKPVSLKELKDDTFISVKPSVSPTLSAMTRRVCSMAGFLPKIEEVQDTDEQIAWIESGRGVSLLVENHVERHNPLISFLPLEENLPVDLVCAWDRLNNNPHIPRLVDAFSSFSASIG